MMIQPCASCKSNGLRFQSGSRAVCGSCGAHTAFMDTCDLALGEWQLGHLNTEKKYVIFSWLETTANISDDEQPLFWSNTQGWVSLESASVFSEREKEEIAYLPLPDGKWLQLPEGGKS